jgi:hypothetical protein
MEKESDFDYLRLLQLKNVKAYVTKKRHYLSRKKKK